MTVDTKFLIETILDQAVPGDLTLSDLLKYVPKMDMWKQIPGLDPETVEVRFTDRDYKTLPGSLTIGEFREMDDVFMHVSIRRGGVMEDA